MNSKLDDEVHKIESCFVQPSKMLPRQALWLSPLDIIKASRGHTPLVHFYQHGDDAAADFFDVGRLKKALAKALVAFYPFAGRLTTDADGRPSIDCNNEGVLFVVARSEQLTVDAFSNLKSLPELRRLFIPCIEPPSTVLAIQVTFLRCGGLALESAVHHSAVDGHSMFHFLQAWSYLCREGDDAAEVVVDLPCHNRALLQPRSPPVVHPDALAMFSPKTNLRERPPGRPVSTKIFAISDDEVAALKAVCGGASTFTAVSALVWRCACAARRLPPDARSKLSFPVNIRRRVRPTHPGPLLRQRDRHRVRGDRGEEHRRVGVIIGDGDDDGVVGQGRRADKRRDAPPGRRQQQGAAAVGRRLPRDGGDGDVALAAPGQGQPAGDGAAGHQLAAPAAIRHGFWMGFPADDVPCRVGTRRVRSRDEWQASRRWWRSRA
uniref:Uncharacterized protein n=1 Tax=Oryza glaberrima TaxID=4538 RepID=I1QGH5_ORYGL